MLMGVRLCGCSGEAGPEAEQEAEQEAWALLLPPCRCSARMGVGQLDAGSDGGGSSGESGGGSGGGSGRLGGSSDGSGDESSDESDGGSDGGSGGRSSGGGGGGSRAGDAFTPADVVLANHRLLGAGFARQPAEIEVPLCLQPYAITPATPRDHACNPMRSRLQPYAITPATLRDSSCNPM